MKVWILGALALVGVAIAQDNPFRNTMFLQVECPENVAADACYESPAGLGDTLTELHVAVTVTRAEWTRPWQERTNVFGETPVYVRTFTLDSIQHAVMVMPITPIETHFIVFEP